MKVHICNKSSQLNLKLSLCSKASKILTKSSKVFSFQKLFLYFSQTLSLLLQTFSLQITCLHDTKDANFFHKQRLKFFLQIFLLVHSIIETEKKTWLECCFCLVGHFCWKPSKYEVVFDNCFVVSSKDLFCGTHSSITSERLSRAPLNANRCTLEN